MLKTRVPAQGQLPFDHSLWHKSAQHAATFTALVATLRSKHKVHLSHAIHGVSTHTAMLYVEQTVPVPAGVTCRPASLPSTSRFMPSTLQARADCTMLWSWVSICEDSSVLIRM